MGTLIGFELRKIVGNRAGVAACVVALGLVLALAVGNLALVQVRDANGGVQEGFAAQQAVKVRNNSHAGVVDDARVQADLAVRAHAEELAATVPGFEDMGNDELIEKYGVEFWQQTRYVQIDWYYTWLANTVGPNGEEGSNLQAAARQALEGCLSQTPAAYTPAEQQYWLAKADRVSWPVEYGYAGGWDNAFDYASFLALLIVAVCVAVSGVFAGEAQGRTAAVVLPTRRGKRALPVAKVLAALLFATAVWWLGVALVLGVNLAVCGADGWGLPFQVTDAVSPYPYTMGQTTLLQYALGYLVMLGMVAFTVLLSARLRSTMPVAVVPLAVTFLGLVLLFVEPLAKWAALTPLAALNGSFSRIASYAAGPVVADLPTLAAVLYGGLLVVCVPCAVRLFRRHQVA